MIWLLLLSAGTAVVTALWPELIASFIFPVCLFSLLLLWMRRSVLPEDRRFLTRCLLFAFFLRLACAYVVEALDLVDKVDAFYDYHRQGSVIGQHLAAGRVREVFAWSSGYSHPGYHLMVGVIYAIFGPNMVLGQNLNTLISALTMLPIYFLAGEVHPDPHVARLAALAFAALPNSVVWSTQLLKDSTIVLLEVTLALDLVRLLNRGFRARTLLRLVTVTAVLAAFRFYVPLLIYGSCALAYVVLAWQARGRRASLLFVSVLLLAGVLGFSMTGKIWSRYLDFGQWSQLDGLRATTLGGESDFARDSRIGSPLDLVQFLPTGMTYFLAGPLPWQARKTAHYLTWLDIPVWYPALVLGFAGMPLLMRRRQALPLVGICLGLTVFYSLFLANLGTAYRMRLQVTPFFLVAAACCWRELSAYRWRSEPHLVQAPVAYRI